jgi:hypothetical protein
MLSIEIKVKAWEGNKLKKMIENSNMFSQLGRVSPNTPNAFIIFEKLVIFNTIQKNWNKSANNKLCPN